MLDQLDQQNSNSIDIFLVPLFRDLLDHLKYVYIQFFVPLTLRLQMNFL